MLCFYLLLACLHQTAPPYLAEELRQSSADEARQRLRSASTSSLVFRRTRLSAVDDRAFPVAAARLWNTLPLNVTSASSISVFGKHLKTHLFTHSFPESPVVPAMADSKGLQWWRPPLPSAYFSLSKKPLFFRVKGIYFVVRVCDK